MPFNGKLRQQIKDLRENGVTRRERRRLFGVSKINKEVEEGREQKAKLDFARWLVDHDRLKG